MKKFLETMYTAPFVELTANFNELKTVNIGFYLPMPEILRCCVVISCKRLKS
ncbi:hypothetical protein [Paenibacillus hamazuiensis]|uniref:hypothetical protein n=1 Tax=Paenibacillus hamazuiensis TaxID=2936508 RepID=UPI00200D8832|nr:hypothetical protein [Paenibacillus hamazuiensis]